MSASLPKRLCWALLGLMCLSGLAAAAGQEQSERGLFEAQGVLDFVLVADMDAVSADRVRLNSPEFQTVKGLIPPPKPRWRPALLGSDRDHWMPIQLRVRGKNRRQPKVCKLPPLKFDFAGKAPIGSPFAGLGKVKAVTHCGLIHDEQDMLGEYLAYGIFNLISPLGLRVRLVRIRYLNAPPQPWIADLLAALPGGQTRYAFFIEPPSAYSRRTGYKILAGQRSGRMLDRAGLARFLLFQRLIGNEDFDLTTGHNLKQASISKKRRMPLPYDLDLANFRKPANPCGCQAKGCCHRGAPFTDAGKSLQEKRSAFEDLVRNQLGLKTETRDRLLARLHAFFAWLAETRDLRGSFCVPVNGSEAGSSTGE